MCPLFTLLIFSVRARFLFEPSMVRNDDAFVYIVFQTAKRGPNSFFSGFGATA